MKRSEYDYVIWFMFGMLQARFLDVFDWWALLFIPLWFVAFYGLRWLWEWKPAQRRIEDYQVK